MSLICRGGSDVIASASEVCGGNLRTENKDRLFVTVAFYIRIRASRVDKQCKRFCLV